MHPNSFLTAGVTAALIVQPTVAHAQNTCISEAEVGALLISLAPAMIEGTREHCGEQLSSDGFLALHGAELAERYAALQAGAWPQARSAFMKFADLGASDEEPASAVLADLSDGVLRPLFEETLVREAFQRLNPEHCTKIERLIEALAPLEPEEAGRLAGVLTALTVKRAPPVCAFEPGE